MAGLVKEIERQGPEVVGAPVRGVAMLARDVGGLFPAGEDGAFARRRRRATATGLARRAVSLAAAVHGVIDDRPELDRAWKRNLAEIPATADPDPDACVQALARVAALALELPALPDDQWQAEMIAFADEALLDELRTACLQLAGTALAVAASEA
jgi:hypothetical protein